MPGTVFFAQGLRRRWFVAFVAAFVLALGLGSVAAQVDKGVTLVKADLIADTTAIVPGKEFTVGLRLKMAPHWHTYWQYSGDAGLPTKIDWQLPEGYKAGPIQWPIPDTIVTPGDIINYGYSDEVVLLTEITPPAALTSGSTATIKAHATWLVCDEKCIPGEAALSVDLAVGGDAGLANAEVFAKYRALLPTPANPADAGVAVQGKTLTFQLNGRGGAPASIALLPLPGENTELGHPAEAKVMTIAEPPSWGAFVIVELVSDPKDLEPVGGVWVLTNKEGNKSGIAFAPLQPKVAQAAPGAAPGVPPPAASPADRATGTFAGPPVPAGSLWHFLLLGFLGGLILNVMPCVLPVISLKLFSFVKQANEDRGRVLRLGLAYAAGVFAWFLGFAALVVGAKSAGGQQIGYAFQFQNPWFLLGLIAVTFVFALNLLGVYEVILPGGITNAAGAAADRSGGYPGAFFQGMLATVLGSACTAPYFFDALAFAFAQRGAVVFVMFAAIAAGMSSPFVILAAFPQWLRFLPKPGVWMERVKQGTGFLMLATVIWLLWTFGGNRRSPDAVVWAAALLLVLGMACWVHGTFNTFVSSGRSRSIAGIVMAALVFGGGWFCVDQIVQAEPIKTAADGSFTAQLNEAQKTGRPVFVDFTARWCAICQSNKKLVIMSDPVQAAFKERGVIFLEADFTARSDEIEKMLHQFNAQSVPLYLLYPAGKPDQPIVLPTLLTQQAVLDAVASSGTSSTRPLAVR